MHKAQSQADETQDALYFVHDGLWKARGHVHDVRGGLEVVCGYADEEDDGDNEVKAKVRKGRWSEFPQDAALTVDRYHASSEGTWSQEETIERLRTNVRRKLLAGEVGVVRSMCAGAAIDGNVNDDDEAGTSMKLPWRIVLEKGGGTVRLVHGEPRRFGIAASVHGGGGDDGDNTAAHEDANAV